MTKGQFIAFCKQLGCVCYYSGKDHVMYVRGAILNHENIEILAIQETGFISDFKIVQLQP